MELFSIRIQRTFQLVSTLTYWQIIKAINKKAVLIGICKYKT